MFKIAENRTTWLPAPLKWKPWVDHTDHMDEGRKSIDAHHRASEGGVAAHFVTYDYASCGITAKYQTMAHSVRVAHRH